MPHRVAILASIFPEPERELDQWVVGEAVDSDHRYIFHLKKPKLVARVIRKRDGISAATGGLSFLVGDTTFYDIEFFGEPPSTPTDMKVLFQGAEAALSRYQRDVL